MRREISCFFGSIEILGPGTCFINPPAGNLATCILKSVSFFTCFQEAGDFNRHADMFRSDQITEEKVKLNKQPAFLTLINSV